MSSHEGTGLLQVTAEEDEPPGSVENDCDGDEDGKFAPFFQQSKDLHKGTISTLFCVL